MRGTDPLVCWGKLHSDKESDYFLLSQVAGHETSGFGISVQAGLELDIGSFWFSMTTTQFGACTVWNRFLPGK